MRVLDKGYEAREERKRNKEAVLQYLNRYPSTWHECVGIAKDLNLSSQIVAGALRSLKKTGHAKMEERGYYAPRGLRFFNAWQICMRAGK